MKDIKDTIDIIGHRVKIQSYIIKVLGDKYPKEFLETFRLAEEKYGKWK
jgi:hypothetical protein